jgi:hypothetical protein
MIETQLQGSFTHPPKRVKRPPLEKTKVEYARLMAIIKTSDYSYSNLGVIHEPTLEGIRHPPLKPEWLAALHMIATKFAGTAEIAHLMGKSSTVVRKRYQKRSRLLRYRVMRGELASSDIVE